MEIRPAEPGDALEASNVLRRSIRELCVEDHRNDEASLQRWLANKTPEQVLAWIASPDNYLLVAVEGGAIAGVAAAAPGGQIRLNYVSPDFRFRGVSKALVSALEDHLRGEGCTRSFLDSSLTAQAFYRAIGYRDLGPAKPHGAMMALPMAKDLSG